MGTLKLKVMRKRLAMGEIIVGVTIREVVIPTVTVLTTTIKVKGDKETIIRRCLSVRSAIRVTHKFGGCYKFVRAWTDNFFILGICALAESKVHTQL